MAYCILSVFWRLYSGHLAVFWYSLYSGECNFCILAFSVFCGILLIFSSILVRKADMTRIGSTAGGDWKKNVDLYSGILAILYSGKPFWPEYNKPPRFGYKPPLKYPLVWSSSKKTLSDLFPQRVQLLLEVSTSVLPSGIYLSICICLVSAVCST